jgi:abortive infection bacteriophage resistance protein
MPNILASVEYMLSPARLARFSSGAEYDKQYAIRLYVWNSKLCEEFYFPLQMAEISLRNCIHYTLERRYTSNWHENPAITGQFTKKYQGEISENIQKLRKAKGAAFTVDHLVASMTFGFWVHLLTVRYDKHLWQQGMKRSFPNIPNGFSREDVHKQLDLLREFRNKVAHHYAIFDRRPMAEYKNIEEVVSWCCADTLWLMKAVSNPPRVINSRPRI